ncbi:MAG TPA: hypothetical protein VE398_25225 [Acidobacteriota bacterium]|nr:hypothetical protein [Acidobacteriota bacterium]
MPQSGKDPLARPVGAELFILTALVSLLVGTVLLFRERELMLGHFYRPEFLAITHTITLGWISMLMMGVLVRLCPRALGIQAKSRRWLLVQYLLMLIGYTGMAFHFWSSLYLGMATAAVLIVLAAGIQIYNFSGVFARLRGPDWLPRYVFAAMLNFLLAAVLGTLLGFNKIYDVIGGQFFPNIFAHAHLAALGWVTMTVIGFEHRLLPTSKPNAGTRWPAIRFWFLEAGVLGLVLSLLAVARWMPLCAAVVAASLWMHAWRPAWMLLRGKVQDRASAWATIAILFMVLDSIAGLMLSLGIPGPQTAIRMRLQLVYGYVGLLGWITLTVMALAYKLFPLFVWEERFRSMWGREPVPAMRDLYSTPVQTLSNGFVSIGVMGTSVGVIAGYLPLITFFHGMVVVGAAAFMVNFFMMARWALLKKEFHPSKEDWERFHFNFPDSRSREPRLE